MLDAAGFICSHITQSTALLRPDSVGEKSDWLAQGILSPSSQTTSPAEERSAQALGPDLLGSSPDDATIY